MASNKLNNYNFTLVKRVAPKNGPFSSDVWNNSIDELLVDLSSQSIEWNSKVIPILNALPNGSLDVTIDAFVNGLDGKNIWADPTAVTGENLYDIGNSRPFTITEALNDLYTSIANISLIATGPAGPTGPAGSQGPAGPTGPSSEIGLLYLIEDDATLSATMSGGVIYNGTATTDIEITLPPATSSLRYTFIHTSSSTVYIFLAPNGSDSIRGEPTSGRLYLGPEAGNSFTLECLRTGIWEIRDANHIVQWEGVHILAERPRGPDIDVRGYDFFQDVTDGWTISGNAINTVLVASGHDNETAMRIAVLTSGSGINSYALSTIGDGLITPTTHQLWAGLWCKAEVGTNLKVQVIVTDSGEAHSEELSIATTVINDDWNYYTHQFTPSSGYTWTGAALRLWPGDGASATLGTILISNLELVQMICY